jgi:NitT/TauT family transport system substrate-binding protein
MPEDFCYNAINNTRLTTHGDNLNFFGLNPKYKGVTGEELYNKMEIKYNDLGFNTAGAKSWRLLASKDIVPAVNVTFEGSEAETAKVFTNIDTKVIKKEALSTKRLSISFRSGEFKLDENAKQLIDLQFIPIAKAFSNSRIRVEGNTDNVGSFASNVSLSKRRAQSVANYLMEAHYMQKNRIIVTGNGPSKPVEGCKSNATGKCRAKNRRTDFELVND